MLVVGLPRIESFWAGRPEAEGALVALHALLAAGEWASDDAFLRDWSSIARPEGPGSFCLLLAPERCSLRLRVNFAEQIIWLERAEPSVRRPPMSTDVTVRPIRNQQDYDRALQELEGLIGAEPGTPAADKLEVLATLVAAFEAKARPHLQADPVEVIELALRRSGKGQAELATLLGSRSRASEILNRKRYLSGDMIAKLSAALRIPAAMLAAPYDIAAGRVRRAVTGIIVALALLVGGAAAWTASLVWIYGQDLPDARSLAGYQPRSITRTDATGQLAERRIYAPLSDIPPHVRKAFLAAEDQHFYDHDGISVWAIARAALQNIGLLGGSRPAGGSTITQQVAKNALLPGQPRSLERKVKEVLLALQIEAELPKDEILEIYLNQIYFGGSQYGVAAAADAYFGKALADLTIAEAAYLAALPKAPNHYRLDQAENLNRAKARRNWVLARMADDGLITPTAAHLARSEPLTREN